MRPSMTVHEVAPELAQNAYTAPLVLPMYTRPNATAGVE